MLQINVKNNSIKLDDLIEAAKRGEEIRIVTDNQETFIVRVEQTSKRRKAGSAKGKVKIADDFDAPLDEFKEYT